MECLMNSKTALVTDEKFSVYKPLDQFKYGKKTNIVDIFAFGILTFYVITLRKHPFSCGGTANIEENIKNNRKNFDAISYFLEPADLIPLLVDLNPFKR